MENLYYRTYMKKDIYRTYYIQTNASTEIKKMKMINAISN